MNNQQVGEAYLQGKTTGKSLHMFIYGQTIYSYGYHFPMAVRINENTYIWNEDGYSNTTTKHKSHCYPYGKKVIFANTTITQNWHNYIFYNENIKNYKKAIAYEENIQYLKNKIEEHKDLLTRKRTEWTKKWEQEQIEKYEESLSILQTL